MKLGVISDIHLDVNEQYPVVELLAKEAERRKAGRIAPGRRYFQWTKEHTSTPGTNEKKASGTILVRTRQS